MRVYPIEVSALGLLPHDGVFRDGSFEDLAGTDPARTLVAACCDPAVGLLAQELARAEEVRLIVLTRSSRAAIGLLEQGLVHVAGVHLARADESGGNAVAVRDLRSPGAGTSFQLLRLADWEEGVAVAPALHLGTIRQAIGAGVRWVGREPGSGARQCLDEVLSLAGRKRRPHPLGLAFDHRGVAMAIRDGWADAGICLRLTSEEAHLDFLSVRREAYELCFADRLAGDPRLEALIRVVRSPAYRRLLAELPGYSTVRTGEIRKVPGTPPHPTRPG
jgi:molybdate-binding protein